MRNGAAGRSWLEELPRVVAELAGRWGLVLGSAFAGGTAGYVVAAPLYPILSGWPVGPSDTVDWEQKFPDTRFVTDSMLALSASDVLDFLFVCRHPLQPSERRDHAEQQV